MARKHNKISSRMLLTWFVLAGLILLFSPQNVTSKFQFAFARVFSLPLSIGRNISLSASVAEPTADAYDYRRIQYENHIANLQQQLIEAHQKVDMLSGIRNRFGLEGAALVPADIIKITTDESVNEIIINRGREEGLGKGQYVLGINNIIGLISSVSARQAIVKLFTDPSSKIPVRIADTGVERVMVGNGKTAAIHNISVKHKIKKGELIFASEKTGFLDVPIIIGKVEQIQRDEQNALVWRITVGPVCQVDQLRQVAVIIMNPGNN